MSWMKALADAHRDASLRHPDKQLMLVSDIDGTILDMRFLVMSTLQDYDRAHGTSYFTRLSLTDVEVHENDITELLRSLEISEETQKSVTAWYLERRWHQDVITNTFLPFPGVFPMIRWFKLQPNTSVGLLTGRPEAVRSATLTSLNKAGRPHRVTFEDEFLLMNPADWEQEVGSSKIAGLARFKEMGYHVFAMIDNEPAILQKLAESAIGQDVTFLHADTIFESKSSAIPPDTVQGRDYGLSELVEGEGALPPTVALVWHGVNDSENLEQFLTSGVFWAEIDIRHDPSGELILRHDSFETTPVLTGEEWLRYAETVSKLASSGLGIKFDIKGDHHVLDEVLASIKPLGILDTQVWFNGTLEGIGENGFRKIRAAHPGAVIQCPINWASPLIAAAPAEARRVLDMLADWGINRFSVDWQASGARPLLEKLSEWGFEVNFYGVPDLEAFLEAVVLLPRSVTSDFNFPMWEYYGRGSGEKGHVLTYGDDSRTL